jgi:hypothetical protein
VLCRSLAGELLWVVWCLELELVCGVVLWHLPPIAASSSARAARHPPSSGREVRWRILLLPLHPDARRVG